MRFVNLQVPEGTVQASKEGKQPAVLLSYDTHKPQPGQELAQNPLRTQMWHRHGREPTALWLDLRVTKLEESHGWY